MPTECNRRCFLQTAGGAICFGALFPWTESLAATDLTAELGPKSKVRVGKVYLGRERPGWPMSSLDLPAEVRRFEYLMAQMPGLADVEFVEGGVVGDAKQIPAVLEKFKNVSGILAIHLSLGTGPLMAALMESQLPLMIFSMPYSGHEWHIVAGWQREGKLVEVLPTSRYDDIAEAVRPFRAIHRLKEARVLHVSQNEANADYVKAARDKFGTDIISVKLPELQQAYNDASRAEAEADTTRWMREAKKIVEPKREDVLKGSLMYVAMKDLLVKYKAQAITMNCLGMGLIDKNMGYPCLGFVRLNNALLAGVCEADVKSTMTQLIFTWLVGRTGFVTDPVFDLSNSTIIHAHCVAATLMEGPGSRPSPYHIRTHLEDNRGVSLQVKMPVGRKVSMAKLLGTDHMLFSTGDAVDSPFVERGCRSKLTTRVNNIERFLSDWSSGLHRVIFYGDHTRDLSRYCRFMKIKLLREGNDDLQNVPGLDWEARVKA
jgi:hypothetical protein